MRFERRRRRGSRSCPSRSRRAGAELMPVFTDGRLRPRLTPTATARPAAVLVLVFPMPRRRGPARPDRAVQLRRPPQRRGQLSRVARPSRGRRRRGATALREAAEEIGLDAGRPPASGSSAGSTRSASRSATSGSPRSSAVAAREPVLHAAPAEVARILTPPVDAFLPGRPDRDGRADDRRLADPLRRLPDRRPPRLGRDGPDPRPARRDPRGPRHDPAIEESSPHARRRDSARRFASFRW